MENCYLCKSDTLVIIQEHLRHGIERKVFSCTVCELVFLDPQRKNLQEFYQKQYRKLHSPVIGKELGVQEFFDINKPLQVSRIEKVRHLLTPSMRVLDVGSSAGMFLNAIRPLVGECIGIEFDEIYARFAEEQFQIKTFTKPIEETDLELHSFDIISVLEVLEHIEDPLRFLSTIKKYLKPGGVVYIEVPNHDDSLLSVFDCKGYRDFYYREPHIFYYNPRTLMTMMHQAGFEGKILPSGLEPNILNQLNWILTEKPQATATLAYGQPLLPFIPKVHQELKRQFTSLVEKFDQEYRKLVENQLLCSHLVFLGTIREE